MNENSNLNNNELVPAKNFTINELAEEIGEPYLVVSAFLKLLVKAGVVREVGKQKNPEGTRGKPSVIYEVPKEVNLVLWLDENEGEPEKSVDVGVNNPQTENVVS